MQLRQYQIDHYRNKIYSIIDPIKRIKTMELQSKKDEVSEIVGKKIRSILKIDTHKKYFESIEDQFVKLKRDYEKAFDKLEEERNEKTQKLKDIFKKQGCEEYHLPTRQFDSSSIEDCLRAIVNTMTDEKCKTMKEFKELNKLDHIKDCMFDALFEEGSSKDMLNRLDAIMKGTLGIGFKREEALQLTKK
jgi:sugar-specific transcriptional regulator TrmB